MKWYFFFLYAAGFFMLGDIIAAGSTFVTTKCDNIDPNNGSCSFYPAFCPVSSSPPFNSTVITSWNYQYTSGLSPFGVIPDTVCCTQTLCSKSACIPTTCAANGWSCGNPPDGCGGTLSCGSGSCSGSDTCGGGGTPYVCGNSGTGCISMICTPNFQCGSTSGTDNCGYPCTATAGTCVAPEVCYKNNCCTPQSCSGQDFVCGGPYPDRCGGTTGFCGSCPIGTNGQVGVCESNWCLCTDTKGQTYVCKS